jgi:hypothetical protein
LLELFFTLSPFIIMVLIFTGIYLVIYYTFKKLWNRD